VRTPALAQGGLAGFERGRFPHLSGGQKETSVWPFAGALAK